MMTSPANPSRARPGRWRLFAIPFLPVLIASLGFWTAGCDPSLRNPEKFLLEGEPDYKTTVKEIYAEFKADRLKAAEKYKQKVVEVTGVVDRVGTDTGDHVYVNLNAEDPQGSVQCFFLKQYEEPASRLQKGQAVRIRGKCTVFVMHVLLEGCVIPK